MKNLLLYLDIDGVLNNERWEAKMLDEEGYNPTDINELSKDNLINFKKLILKLQTKYNVEIILSSSWRWYPETLKAVKDQLADFDLALAGTTDVGIDVNMSRTKEIEKHLKENWAGQDILILDDEKIDNPLKSYHFKTTMNKGLTYSLVKKILTKML